jgi:hypothetical protein
LKRASLSLYNFHGYNFIIYIALYRDFWSSPFHHYSYHKVKITKSSYNIANRHDLHHIILKTQIKTTKQ